MRWLTDWFGALYDEVADRTKRGWQSTKECFYNWWKGRGGWIRRIVDFLIMLAIGIWIPAVAIGFAAANFTDKTDTVSAVVTTTIAYIVLDFIAFFAMELIIILGMFQVAFLTTRYLRNVERRKQARINRQIAESIHG